MQSSKRKSLTFNYFTFLFIITDIFMFTGGYVRNIPRRMHHDILKISNVGGRCSIFYETQAPSKLHMNGGGSSLRDGMGKPKGYMGNKRYVQEHETLSGLPDRTKPYLVLGLETSCDDTGAAVVGSDGRILSNVVYSQHEIHEKFGGIVPGLAMEGHKSNIDRAVEEAIKQAGLDSAEQIDAVAVTKGPGLEICLRVGYKKALTIAREFKKPFVNVHHLEAHCLMARLAGAPIVKSDINGGNNDRDSDSSHNSNTVDNSISDNSNSVSKSNSVSSSYSSDGNITIQDHFQPKVAFPFLVLLVSGGHTSILICHDLGEYSVLGGTLDDSLGEAFDKAARLLGLRTAGSGGAAVEAMASMRNKFDNGNSDSGDNGDAFIAATLKVPMRDKPNCDFSYAGLKNAFRGDVSRAREYTGLDANSTNAPKAQMQETTVDEIISLPLEISSQLCDNFQDAAFSHLEDRVNRALNYLDDKSIKANALVVVGGVAANLELRQRLLSLLQKRTDKLDKEDFYENLRKQSKASGTNNANVDSSVDMSDNGSSESSSSGGEASSSRISRGMQLIFPPPSLCTDNGVMAAWAGIEKLNLGISNEVTPEPIEGEPYAKDVVARWPLGEPVYPFADHPANSARKKNGVRRKK